MFKPEEECSISSLLPPQDLARWKSRRRSASQDLIKKEEERKKMEKLLAGEDGTRERRKSIKTYREIVQEKWVLSVVVEWVLLSRCTFSLKMLVIEGSGSNCILSTWSFSSLLVPTKVSFAISLTANCVLASPPMPTL